MNILYFSQAVLILLYVLALILFILSSPNFKAPKGLLSIFLLSLIVIAVTRPDTTADTNNYMAGFQYGDFSERMEPMYAFIVTFSRIFPFPVFIGFSIYAIISIKPRFDFIKKYSPAVWASVLIYISYCYIAQDIVAMRSAAASVMLLFIIDYKLKGNRKKMLLCILIAILFHYTAIAFFLLYLIEIQRKQRLVYVTLLLGCYVLYFIGFDIRILLSYFLNVSFLEYNLIHYISNTNDVYGTLNGPQILRISACLFFWFKIDDISRTYPNATLYLKLFTISLCMFPIFSSIDIMGYRFYELFASAEIILFPMCFMGAFKNPVVYKSGIIIYSSYFFYNSISSLAYWMPDKF